MKKIIMLAVACLLLFCLKSDANADYLNAYDEGWHIGVWSDSDGFDTWEGPSGRNYMYLQGWWLTDYSYQLDDDNFVLENASNPSTDSILMQFTGDSYTSLEGLSIDLLFDLDGASAYSKVFERLTLANARETPIALTLYEYDDIDVGEQSWSDNAYGDTTGITATDEGDTTAVNVTPLSPVPDYFEIDDYDYVYDDVDGGYDLWNGYSVYNNADIGFAFQWNITIPAGQSFEITKNKEIFLPGYTGRSQPIPEPATMVLLGSGLLGGGLYRRRQKYVFRINKS